MMRHRRLKTRINFSDTYVDRLQVFGLVVALAVLLGCMLYAYVEHDNAARLRAQWSQPASTAGRPAAAIRVAARADGRERAEAIVAEQLNLPFFEMMKALEPPPDIHVVLLALDLRVRAGQARDGTLIRLTSEAQALRDMTNYLEWLSTRKSLVSATLSKHQVQVQQPGQPVRFEIEVVAR